MGHSHNSTLSEFKWWITLVLPVWSYSPFFPGRTTGIQQTTKVDRDCNDRPVIKVSNGMNPKKRKQRTTTTKQAIIKK